MPASAIAICTTSAGAPWQQQRGRGRGQRAHQQRALAADDDEAELRRQRRAQRREDERRCAGQRVLPGEPGAEGALVHVEIEVERILAEQRDEDAEGDERRHQGERGNDDVFRRAADAIGEGGAQIDSCEQDAAAVASRRDSVRSAPPCGEGLGVGVGVIARAASAKYCPHLLMRGG